MEIFFRVSFYWDLLQFINDLLLANFNARSWSKIQCTTNSLSCEGHIISVFRVTRCSISVPLVPKRLSTKRLMISGLVAMGSSIFSHAASASVRTRGLFWDVACVVPLCIFILVPGSPTRLYWVQHVTATISSRGESCHNYTVLRQGYFTSVGRHHSCRMQVSSILQLCQGGWLASDGNWHTTSRFTS